MGQNAQQDDRIYTIEEYERLPDDDRFRTELVRGRLVREPPPGEEHGWLQVRFGRYLDEYVEQQGLGLVVAETGYRLVEHPGTVRGPDLSFVSQARLTGGYPVRRFRSGAPDLAVEIVSPASRSRDLVEKVHEYLDAGARLVWVVNPVRRTITVYRSRTQIHVLRAGDVLDGEDVLPGFRMEVDRLFAV
jgi:Uma2 family endonuclease